MNELEQNFLEHHGILGQKWHKRNGPPYPLDAGDHSKSEQNAGYKKSLGGGRNEELYDRKVKKKEAKQVTKQLNKMDKDLAYEKREAGDAKAKSDWYEKKIAKKEAKGKKVSEKLQNKSKVARERYEKEMADVRRGKEEVDKILDSINAEDFNIKAKDTIRTTNTGKDYAVALLASTASAVGFGAMGAPFYFVYTPFNYQKGTQYKVKAKTDKEKNKNITVDDIEKEAKRMNNGKPYDSLDDYTSAYKKAHDNLKNKPTKAELETRAIKSGTKQARLDRAKKEDKWDLNFLEAVQNSKMFEDNDTSKMLKEYSKYLDDPQEYWKNIGKLPQA